MAAEAGLIDPESPHAASVPVENYLFNVETNGHADDLENDIGTSGNPGDDVGGTSESNQEGGQGGNQETTGNPPDNPANTDNPDAGEENGNTGGSAGNPGGDPPHPGGYGGFSDPEYMGQQNEDEEGEEEEEEIAQMEEEHAEDVAENIAQNLLDLPLPFAQNPLHPGVHLPQNSIDGQVGDLENQVMMVQSAGVQSGTHGDFNQAVQVLGSYGDLNPNAATDTAEPSTTAEEDAPQETEPEVEGDVDANILNNNPGNVDGKGAAEHEGEVGVSNIHSPHGENGVNPGTEGNGKPRDVENVEDQDNGNQVQSEQLATGNGTSEEGLPENSSQHHVETLSASNEEESQTKSERRKESSENTKRSDQPLLTTCQREEAKSDVAQVKTEQLDEMDTDSDALATLASAALGCDQAPTNGVKAELQVGT